MGVARCRVFRVLAGVCCSIGVLGIADPAPTTFTILTLAVLSSAVMLSPLFTGPSLVAVTMQPPKATR